MEGKKKKEGGAGRGWGGGSSAQQYYLFTGVPLIFARNIKPTSLLIFSAIESLLALFPDWSEL